MTLIKYKGYTIRDTFRHGYKYYKIEGDKTLYTTIKAAKNAIDTAYNILTMLQ